MRYVFSSKWGSQGSGDGQFRFPIGVALDSSDNVYVSDSLNQRIQKFRLSNPCPAGTTQVVPGVCFITKWGSEGSGDGQFKGPSGVAVDSSGNVYVADGGNNRIQKFRSDGSFIRAWGTHGFGDGEFFGPGGVALDSSDNLYVSDISNNRIQKFRNDGTFIRAWGSLGTGDGQFAAPEGVAVDSSGNVYVADRGNNRIQKFRSDGSFIRSWSTTVSGDDQHLSGPVGIAVDSFGNVYITDGSNQHRIQKFTNTGNFITRWGSQGTADGQLSNAIGLAIKSSNISFLEERVYVTDMDNHRIQVFRPELVVHQ